ncbi:MAG TPA: universal stress protein [Gammaproteobacteria bacterium]|nr:universal stress protein [Gammaproteobacteria bacterium]
MTAKRAKQPILVPIDFSANSEAALLQAAELAEALQAPVSVLHVVHDLTATPGYKALKGAKKQLRRMEDIANEMLQEYLQAIQKKYPSLAALQDAEKLLVVGIPVTRILEAADKINARMIVMGSQGRTGLSHILLGSKAEQVVHLSRRPVLIIKDGHKK